MSLPYSSYSTYLQNRKSRATLDVKFAVLFLFRVCVSYQVGALVSRKDHWCRSNLWLEAPLPSFGQNKTFLDNYRLTTANNIYT